MRGERLTPEFFGSDDPNFNLDAAIAAYSWVMREEEPVAKFVLGDVVSEVVYEEVEKNYDGFSAYIRKQAQERKELVKKSLARAVLEGTMTDEAVQETIDAMEIISKADSDYEWDESKHKRDASGRFALMGRTRPTYPKRNLLKKPDIKNDHLRVKAKNLGANDAREFETAYLQIQAELGRLGVNVNHPADAVVQRRLADGSESTDIVTAATSAEDIVDPEFFNADKSKILNVEYYETGQAKKVTHPDGSVTYAPRVGTGATMGHAVGMGDLNPAAVGAWRGLTTAQMMQMQNDPELSGATRGMRNVGNAASLADSLGVGETSPKVKAALAAGKLVGDMGPEAEKVIGPGIRRAAYRYRGTERSKPDKDITMARDATLRPVAQSGNLSADTVRAAITQPRVAEGTEDTYGSPLIRAMQNRLPDSNLVDLHANSGRITPSEGILLDEQGNILSQAVGNADDHYLPFNLYPARPPFFFFTRVIFGPSSAFVHTYAIPTPPPTSSLQ